MSVAKLIEFTRYAKMDGWMDGWWRTMTESGFSGLLERKSVLRDLTPIDVFPVSLSMIHAAGLGEYLSDQTVQKLRHIEGDLQQNVQVSGVLQAPSEQEMVSRFDDALTLATTYYVQSGIAIWQDLKLDYTKLMNLTRVSCGLIEDQLFRNRRKLGRSSLVVTVAGVRVLREVGRLHTEAQEHAPPGNPPLGYLAYAVYSTFALWCLLVYLQENIENVRRSNVTKLVEFLFLVAKEAYRDALEQGLFESEARAEFWSPDWQKGEVEADLDERDRRVKTFNSVKELIKDLHSS